MTKRIQTISKYICPIIYGGNSSDAIFGKAFFLLKNRNDGFIVCKFYSNTKKASKVKLPLSINAQIIGNNFKLF